MTLAFVALVYLTKATSELVSIEWEEEVGKKAIDQVLTLFDSGAAFCTNPAGVAALDRLTSRLLATIDALYDVRVRVTNVEKINAFAMLGGDIVLFKGLILMPSLPRRLPVFWRTKLATSHSGTQHKRLSVPLD